MLCPNCILIPASGTPLNQGATVSQETSGLVSRLLSFLEDCSLLPNRTSASGLRLGSIPPFAESTITVTLKRPIYRRRKAGEGGTS